jgi:putative hydrolase of the HAD superfamily
MFEGALVDLFGTLVPAPPRSSRAPHLHAMAGILGVDPVEFEADWARSFEDRVYGRLGSLSQTLERLSARQGKYPSADPIRRAGELRVAWTRAVLDASGPVLPGLDRLRGAGMRLAVVSDTSAEVPYLWPSTELGRRFDASVFSCEEGFCKPDPRMYRRALDRLGLRAERCAFVGDGGSRELTGAGAVGLSAFLYRFPGEERGVESRYDPDTGWVGPSLASLADLLTIRVRTDP